MQVLERIARNRFLVIGRAGLDLYADPPGTPIEEARGFTAQLGGSSANIAVAITRHGGAVDLLTCVSDDAVGRYALGRLSAHGIGAQYVRSVGGEARNSLAVVDTCGPATQAVIYRNGAADFEMTVADVEAVDHAPYGGMITTGTVLSSQPSRDAAFRAFELGREAGVPLIFDVDYRPYSWASAKEAEEVFSRAAAMCDIIVGNDDEFGFMAGDHERGLDKARALAADGAICIYKMGARGSVTLAPGVEFATGIYEVDALKPTGAGDGFMGGFVTALAAGRDLRDAVHRGAASAAIVVGRVGCAEAMPDAAELEEFMAGHPGPEVSGED